MLSLARSQVSRPLCRSLATISDAIPKAPRRNKRKTPKEDGPPAHAQWPGRVPVREDHGLYGFFRQKPGADLVGEDRFEVFETPESGQILTGRSWKAAELRNKSFKDLHTLWYVSLREKNLMATQKEEVRRMGVTSVEMQVPLEKVRRCRKTMARIKAVLNERRLAYEAAVELAQQERDSLTNAETEDDKVAQYLETVQHHAVASQAQGPRETETKTPPSPSTA